MAESSFAIVSAESAPPFDGTLPPVFGALFVAPPVPVEPPGCVPVELLDIDAVVSAQAVPPPAPTQAMAKTASAVRRNPEPRGRCAAGGQAGGPHWGSDDQ
jgi:hypothetical protein